MGRRHASLRECQEAQSQRRLLWENKNNPAGGQSRPKRRPPGPQATPDLPPTTGKQTPLPCLVQHPQLPPFPPVQLWKPAPVYHTHQDHKNKERSFNAVFRSPAPQSTTTPPFRPPAPHSTLLMQHRDADKETATQARETQKRDQAVSNARAKQFHYEQKVDPVSHLPRQGYVQPLNRGEGLPKQPDTRLTYNIVSHKGGMLQDRGGEHRNYETVPLSPEVVQPRQKGTYTINGLLPMSHAQRPFNVLSNKWTENNAQKEAEERALIQDEARIRGCWAQL